MLVKRISEGELIPRWYGVAWEDWNPRGRFVVCLPFGMNIVAQLLRATYYSIKHGNRAMRANPRAAYEQGYGQALKDLEVRKDYLYGGSHDY